MPLWAAILKGLRKRWSPEQISGRLREDFPHNESMNACVETIYRAIYIQGRGELRAELEQALRQGRAKRKPQGQAGRRPRLREPMAMTGDRPAEIGDRAIPGHQEGDLILGAGGNSQIGTPVEHATRFVILLHLPGRRDAETVQDAIIRKMRTLPKHLRNTPARDQGGELALHQRIAMALDMQVHFCDLHSPWQRGANENTNGLLRQYFPKGTDLSDTAKPNSTPPPTKPTTGQEKPSDTKTQRKNHRTTSTPQTNPKPHHKPTNTPPSVATTTRNRLSPALLEAATAVL